MKLRIPQRKYVYVFHVVAENFNVPLWLSKCGHAEDEEQRARNIEASIYEETGKRVNLKVFLKAKMWLYRPAETAVHKVLSPLRADTFKPASGWTEFFREVNPYCAAIVYIVLWAFSIPGALPYSVAIALTPRPLDMSLCVILLLLVEWAFIAALVWLAWMGGAALVGIIQS